MPVDLGSIPQEDRQDFERRLQTYGLTASALQEELVVGPSSTISLAYGPGRQTVRQPYVLQTTDLAAVKRMVGIDDRVFQRNPSKAPLPGRIDLGQPLGVGRLGVAEAEGNFYTAAPGLAMDDPRAAAETVGGMDLSRLDDESVNNIRVAARAYVRGNSQLVASYRPIVERAIGQITLPIWPLLKVTVAAGSVLQFGPGVNVLVAWEVEIQEGGRIRSQGHLTVNCTRMRKPGRAVVVRPDIGFTGGFRPIFRDA